MFDHLQKEMKDEHMKLKIYINSEMQPSVQPGV